MKARIRFIINPISGVGKKNVIPKLIEQNLNLDNFDYDIVYTEYRGHARIITKEAVEQHINIVCIVGGDGSVNEVGTTLIDSQTALAILPTGSGNGIARHLGIPLNLKKAIQRINTSTITKIDTLTINNIPAIGVSGFGFDALIAKKFDEYHDRGLKSYVKLVLKEWKKFKGINIKIGDVRYTNLLFCSIANTNQFGNNVYVSPQSEVNDGQFELVLAKLPSTFGMLKFFIFSIFKKVHILKKITIIPTDSISFEIDVPLGHIDGDPFEFEENLIEVICKPKSLKVV